MTTSSSDNHNLGEGKKEAVLFEAISHPTRIKLLFILERSSMGFAEVKREIGITSSGNLQHHIGKLTTLVEIKNGDYVLSDLGRDALVAIRSLRSQQNHQDRQSFSIDSKIITLGATLSYYVVQMNMPFVYGNIDPLTPIYVLVSSVVFSVVFYPIFRYLETRRMQNDIE